MTGAKQTPGTRPPTNTILGLIASIAFVIAALTFIDLNLEKAERRDLASQARRAHLEGASLIKQGKAEQGIDFLRKAHALERANTLYELDLIDALIAAAKTEDAEPLMNEILLREPGDGRANLTAARLMLERGKAVDAVSYFHRAIYGDWPENATAHRVAARMELVRLLVKNGRDKELLAELLPLQEEARKEIDHNPKNTDAYAALGEAQLEQGQYRDAHAAFLAALRYRPEDPSIRRQLDLSSALTDLDPTPRLLTSLEKYRRSLHILQLAYDNLNGCIANRPEVSRLLSRKPPSNPTNELSEGVLATAEKIWQACGAGVSPKVDPLRLIMQKLAETEPRP